MAIREKEFLKELDQIKIWIKESVSTFKNDTAKTKQDRIERARKDKEFFAKTYLPHYAECEFDDMHRDMFALCDQWNTPTAIAGYRECAKSTVITLIDEIHKTVFQENYFTIVISNSEETAVQEYLYLIKCELEGNPRIVSDFGEQRSSKWQDNDFITKSGKRFLGLGWRQSARGKKYKQHRPDRVIIEDMENINSSRKKSQIRKKIKYITNDVWKGLKASRRQLFFLGNYFSKKTIIHILLTSDEFKHWNRRIYRAIETDKKTKKEKSTWEARHPYRELKREREEQPSTFRVEMMQKPESEEDEFTEDMFKYYKPEDIADLTLMTISYFDPSALKGETGCLKAIIVLAVDKLTHRMYVLHVWMEHCSKWQSVKRHHNISEKHECTYNGIESNAFQSTLQEDYEKFEEDEGRKIMNLKLISNKINKEARIERLQTPIETGKILFLRNAEQQELVDQFLDYPDGDFVDGMDALEGALQVAERYVLKKRRKVSVEEIDLGI